MHRNVFRKYAWLAWGAALLVAVLALRYGVIEADRLPRDCDAIGGGASPSACTLKWLLVQSFHDQRLGWFSLASGVLAFVLSHRVLAWAGWLGGIAGIVLYGYDYAAVGGLLALLVLLRPREHGGKGEREPGKEPGDGLGISGLR